MKGSTGFNLSKHPRLDNHKWPLSLLTLVPPSPTPKRHQFTLVVSFFKPDASDAYPHPSVESPVYDWKLSDLSTYNSLYNSLYLSIIVIDYFLYHVVEHQGKHLIDQLT